MSIPAELKYTKDHEWVRMDGDIAIVGITAFAQGELGDIVYVEIETVGESLDREEVFGSIEAVKTVSDLFMPLSGEILELNEKIIKIMKNIKLRLIIKKIMQIMEFHARIEKL